MTARCARLRQEIVMHTEPGDVPPIAGTMESLSYMFAPLLVGERLLGVMTVQSHKPNAYAEREVAIFRTLCAYGAIALANAESQSQLIQSEKMASLGQLVANVAHEVNTPIGAIKSSGASIADALGHALEKLPQVLLQLDQATQTLFLELIQSARSAKAGLSSREDRAARRAIAQQLEQAGVKEAQHHAAILVQIDAQLEVEHFLPLLHHARVDAVLDCAAEVTSIVRSAGNINTAVESVSKIIFALKVFSRVNLEGEMVEARLSDGLDTVLTIYNNQIKRGIELVRQYDAVPPLRCWPDELNQVWTNLVHNALQAMNYQGTLTVALQREGSYAVVTVSDTGCGIPQANMARIFDPFFTTKPLGEGSGLGLDIAKKIVEKHRGRIAVHSKWGVGSTFTVHLPLQT